ncbi:MAG: rod shape-determining protein RodA [Clostridia bacterium]|nr:rod shape-determining protein RodA [Clostridia bacterium]
MMKGQFASVYARVRALSQDRTLLRYFDWPLVAMALTLSLWGVVSIFAATGSPVDEGTSLSFLQMLSTQSTRYPGLQLMWIALGMSAMVMVSLVDYHIMGRFKDLLYWGNIALLILVKVTTVAGRGAANMFFQWGSGRTFQPAEVGKIAIIIALARVFADREKPVDTVMELFRLACYVGLPLALIVIQPDVGTALVYVFIFATLIFVSGTNRKLIIGVICLFIVMIVPLWYFMTYSDSFRVARIQVWLDPNYDINDSGMQTYNARLALGSGGLWGKGLFAVGNFAALNYIPDDHTDFIFAIVCETFGFAGGALMIGLFFAMVTRMIVLARRAMDALGYYVIMGVMAMMLFHIFENISMVIGLMPVTGIPLPFVSYGGSSYLTNSVGLGLVLNVTMRSRAGQGTEPRPVANPKKLI